MTQRNGANPCAWIDSVAGYALGSLDRAELVPFEDHLATGCPECRSELDAMREVVARLERAHLERVGPENATPPVALKQRVMQRIRSASKPEPEAGSAEAIQVWRNWLERPTTETGIVTTREADDWDETAVPGVFVRRLAVDPALRSVTMMVRMEPDSAYPKHRHAGFEQCLVLAGDLQVEGKELRAGDFQTADVGSVHDVQSTKGGCTLLIVSSVDDELL